MVTHVSYNGKNFVLGRGESVLDCLLRAGQGVAYSCRAGVCHSCMMRMPAGKIPPRAQESLSQSIKQQGFFLACQCYPESDIEVVQAVPESDFCYMASDKNCGMILVGVGTGIARLYSIAKDALSKDHKGDIIFYNVAVGNELYMGNELERLAGENINFIYIPCLPSENFAETAEKIVAGLGRNKNSIIAYLCGVPEMIDPIREQIFMAGVSPTNIYAGY